MKLLLCAALRLSSIQYQETKQRHELLIDLEITYRRGASIVLHLGKATYQGIKHQSLGSCYVYRTYAIDAVAEGFRRGGTCLV